MRRPEHPAAGVDPPPPSPGRSVLSANAGLPVPQALLRSGRPRGLEARTQARPCARPPPRPPPPAGLRSRGLQAPAVWAQLSSGVWPPWDCQSRAHVTQGRGAQSAVLQAAAGRGREVVGVCGQGGRRAGPVTREGLGSVEGRPSGRAAERQGRRAGVEAGPWLWAGKVLGEEPGRAGAA